MIDPHLFLGFVAAVIVLLLIPGPNVALIVANSVGHGARYGLLTVAGTTSGAIVQLFLAVVGLTALLGAAGSWFEWLRAWPAAKPRERRHPHRRRCGARGGSRELTGG